ncbi:MAG: hypothetical protein Q9191_001527, partial [Dirinaria sp. TL-2023a]
MEKIKNILNPGHKKDEEIMYGSGRSDDPVHTGAAGQAEGNPLTSNPVGHDTATYGGAQTGTAGPSATTSATSRMPGSFGDDTDTTASVKSGVVGDPQASSAVTGSGTTDPLNTNKSLPREPETSGTGYASGATGAGPHSSSLANKADPRVDSDLDGSRRLGDRTTGTAGTGSGLTGTSLPDRGVGSSNTATGSTTGSSHLGRDAALGAGAAGVAEGAHHHREKQEIGAGSAREFPLGGSSTTSGSGYPSGTTGTATGSGAGSAVPTGSYGAESWKHDHGVHGHKYEGDPCGPEESAPGAPHFTQGPHVTDTANRLDPRVGSDIGAPTGSTNTGASPVTGSDFGSSTIGSGRGATGTDSTPASSTTRSGLGSSTTGDRHLGRDAALAGGAGAAGAGAYEASRDGPAPTTAGPHKSDLLNKVDPRVDSDLSKQRGTSGAGSTGIGPGSTTKGPASGVTGSTSSGTALPSDVPTSGSSSGRDHHYGRDVGIAGAGAGAAGLGAYEAEKHHRGQQPSSTPSDSSGAPYSSSTVDPRVDSTARSEISDKPATTSTGKDHHYGRDAGLAGAGGLAAYEGQKHLGSKQDPVQSSTAPTSTTSNTPEQVLYDSGRGPTTSSRDQGVSGTGHHLGRDAGGAGAGAAAAYEADKHLGRKEQPLDTRGSENRGAFEPTRPSDERTGHHYGRDAALGAGGVGAGAAAYEAGKSHDAQPPIGTTTGYDDQTAVPKQSHTGRDAALAGGAGAGAGALAGHEMSKKEAEREAKAQESHTGRDAALAGGAGAGAGALAGHEVSKKEAEREAKAQQKEIAKEQKAHDKEIAKEQKAHEKEVEKAEKKHEKEVAAAQHKAEKKHEKELSAAEKKHEKELEKEEKKEEKKSHHGGILGLFHRDKPDDELKRENLERKGEVSPQDTASSATTASTAGTAGAASAAGLSDYERHERAGDHAGMSEGDKLRQAREHDRNRLHKDPPPGYVEKKLEKFHGEGGYGSEPQPVPHNTSATTGGDTTGSSS